MQLLPSQAPLPQLVYLRECMARMMKRELSVLQAEYLWQATTPLHVTRTSCFPWVHLNELVR